ncbi:zinc ribbon domain-containing protein [Serratia sp. CY71147]|uniref:zinc ribbon domain-containing protein n=1 Tax=Serratia sp. CY71147 TaxID=3383673 RepID=UPI003FA09D43
MADAGLGEFFWLLEYKCAWHEVKLLKVGRWEPSSKLCCSCGEFNADLILAMRTWTCPSCGSGFH